MKLACIGDVGIDDYANLGLRCPGGIALNVAVSARMGGIDVALVSALGDDAGGDVVSRAITPIGFDLTRLRRLPGQTARQCIHLEPGGERRFTGYAAGVLADWRLDADDLAMLAAHDAVFAPLADGLEAIFDQIASLTGPTMKAADFSVDSALANGSSLEQSLRRYASAFDVVTVGGRSEHMPLIAELATRQPETRFVLTLGAAGALAFHHGERFTQPAVPVARVVDTTGCGDAFQGALLATLVRGGTIPGALQAGVHRAAVVIGHAGSTTIPLPD